MKTVKKDNPNKGLSFLYNTYLGRIILKPLVKNKLFSNVVASFMNSKLSKIMVKPFIKKHNINMDEFVKEDYNCFNDFFIRKIKKEARDIDKDKKSFISPCDSKLTCYKITKDLVFNVKNSTYSISSITKDDNISDYFKDGYALVFRLSPDDYHRYIFLDDGKIINNYKINGKYHSVNPVSYDKFKVFKENTRECTLMKCKNFNNIMYIEVGALLVGKINNIKKSGTFKRAEEKGYFMYGGSTIVVLVGKNIVKMDKKIIINSLKNIETSVKCGEKIGEKID